MFDFPQVTKLDFPAVNISEIKLTETTNNNSRDSFLPFSYLGNKPKTFLPDEEEDGPFFTGTSVDVNKSYIEYEKPLDKLNVSWRDKEIDPVRHKNLINETRKYRLKYNRGNNNVLSRNDSKQELNENKSNSLNRKCQNYSKTCNNYLTDRKSNNFLSNQFTKFRTNLNSKQNDDIRAIYCSSMYRASSSTDKQNVENRLLFLKQCKTNKLPKETIGLCSKRVIELLEQKK